MESTFGMRIQVVGPGDQNYADQCRWRIRNTANGACMPARFVIKVKLFLGLSSVVHIAAAEGPEAGRDGREGKKGARPCQ